MIKLTLLIRRRQAIPTGLIHGPEVIARDELVARYGADPADLDLVAARVRQWGFEVLDTDSARRHVVISGAASTATTVFGDGVPSELTGVVLGVFGLTQTPVAAPMYITIPGTPQIVYSPIDLGKLYDFPDGFDGTGQTLAVISLGGGYRQQDIDEYFGQLGLRPPKIHDVAVDGAHNDPGGSSQQQDDVEVTLDLQIAAALAPGAQLVAYHTSNSDTGILHGLHAAVHGTPTPTAISISWGSLEDASSKDLLTALDDTLSEAAALGITVCAASGDNGSSGGEYDGKPHAVFPASSPHVLAVGGTTLVGDPASGKIDSETVWHDGSGAATGGGVSSVFDQPSWQANADVPYRIGTTEHGRGLPDVAADADAMTGYQIRLQGKTAVVGGTSAATPLWAALVCRIAQATGRPLGLLAPLIYQDLNPHQVTAGFRDVVAGDNGAYAAAPGWDPNTGLGSPDGETLLAALRGRLSH